MEDYNCEMINIFNKNFETKDFKNIINLYKKEIFMIEYFEESNFKQEYKFRHPLFKNYNYCFFCEKKEKTKYTKNLEDIHIPLKTKTIGEFLFSNKIKLRPIYNKKLKLAKRRLIVILNYAFIKKKMMIIKINIKKIKKLIIKIYLKKIIKNL